MTYEFLKSYFPAKTFRKGQEECLKVIYDTFFVQNKKFCVICAPTGIGKSYLAYTVSKAIVEWNKQNKVESEFENRCHILTSQRSLQEQYSTEFEDINSIWSKSNYKCSLDDCHTCEDGYEIKSLLQEPYTKQENKCKNNCQYEKAFNAFLKSDLTVSNYQYFLNASKGKVYRPGELVVLDEGHLVEKELWNYIENELNEHFVKEEFKIRLETDPLKVVNWIKITFLSKLHERIKYLKSVVEELEENGKDDLSAVKEAKKKLKRLNDLQDKLIILIEDYDKTPNNYVITVEDFYNQKLHEVYKKVCFRPINVDKYTDRELFRFGKRVLILSATLDDDEYEKNLGMNTKDYQYFQVPSPFKKENRLIHYIPIGSMSYKNIEQTLPVMLNIIKELMKGFTGHKGIIHAPTYKIQNFLKENLKDKRLIFHSSTDRMDKFEEFVASRGDKVFVATAFSTGIDLKDDLCRFQIITKIPYLYLGDEQVKRKMEFDPNWYGMNAAIELVQTLGRGVRHENDWAESFILDSDFDHFYAVNKKYIPEYIQEALVFDSK